METLKILGTEFPSVHGEFILIQNLRFSLGALEILSVLLYYLC